ncbi:hypothetical protein HW555_004607 [Spodoptera exigua]|uniref:Leucine-rich repeat-containing protein 71 n=1 Tax=Spodoptera exigua TaxID=7107 RepID=A0A835L880_SPOEX|nr:hypothetical protein HW555_004607 [Spodoptera exigua]
MQQSMDYKSEEEDSRRAADRPSPADFDTYLPWACNQLTVDATIFITRTYRSKERAKVKSKLKSKIRNETDSDGTPSSQKTSSGLHAAAIYELSKMLTKFNITEICLDSTYVPEGNYHILLKNVNLKHLSLSKCSINDAILKPMALELSRIETTSKLCALNLTTNKITDIGAKYLAQVLRTNRNIGYLNLADNMIGDDGAISIFNTLVQFPLTPEEAFERRNRLVVRLKEKNNLLEKTIKNMQIGDLIDKKMSRRKPNKPPVASAIKKKADSFSGMTKSMELLLYERAEIIVGQLMGSANDPFSRGNIELRDSTTYCLGNNTLSYLNLAYNNLSHVSIKKLCDVLMKQKLLARKPHGLINVVIDGNYLSENCMEYKIIDDCLMNILSTYGKVSQETKKKTTHKAFFFNNLHELFSSNYLLFAMSSLDQRIMDWTYPPKPMPDDFENFVPWACVQMSVESKVVVTKTTQSDYVSVKASPSGKAKKLKAPTPVNAATSTESIDDPNVSVFTGMEPDNKICIDAIYDTNHNLIQIKFLKNRKMPRKLFKIIGLIIRFQKHLTSIVINSGLTCETIYDISKFLPLSRITEICLDHTHVKEANYVVLLERGSLKHLSLARCGLTDLVVKSIAPNLFYHEKAAKTLVALNLASNRITDEGVQYLADALRSNRQLGYLNLSDNLITDIGAQSLFDILTEFPLTILEEQSRKARRMAYLNRKLDLIIKTAKEVKITEFEKKVAKRKTVRPTMLMSKKKSFTDKDSTNSGTGTANLTKSLGNMETLFNEKAVNIVNDIIGPFVDPFDGPSIFVKHNKTYCYGNNTLCYLNIAYNNLTYTSVKKLRNVVLSQFVQGRKPRGLINVKLEGNYVPKYCKEMADIDDMLGSSYSSYGTKTPPILKKKVSKIGKVKSMGLVL